MKFAPSIASTVRKDTANKVEVASLQLLIRKMKAKSVIAKVMLRIKVSLNFVVSHPNTPKRGS